MHILSHYFDVSETDIVSQTQEFAKLNRWWVAQIGEIFVYDKGMSINDYVRKMEKFPADELFLTVFARMQGIQIGVLMRDYYWTTAHRTSIDKCEIILGYDGNHTEANKSFPVLFDTKEHIISRPPREPAPPEVVEEVARVLATLRYPLSESDTHENSDSAVQNVNVDESLQSVTAEGNSEEALLSGNSQDGLQSGHSDSGLQSGSSHSGLRSGNSDSGLQSGNSSSDENSDVGDLSSGTDMNVQSGNEGGLQTGNNVTTASTEGSGNNTLPPTEQSASEPSRRTTRSATGKKSSQQSGRSTQTSINAGLVDPLPPKTRRKRPTSLIEADPIGEALGGLSPLQSNDDGSSAEEGRSTQSPPSKRIKTEAGQLKVTQHAIRRTQKKVLKLKCPILGCDVRSSSEAERNTHVKEMHPDHKFKCDLCEKIFLMKNGLWKHTNKHYVPKHPCTWEGCNHLCYYKSDLEAHMKTHTKTGLIPCTWKGCSRAFVSTKNMYSHLESHNDKTYKCEECDTIFQTKYNLQQHNTGKHSDDKPDEGLKSKCGKLFKWPENRSRHQESCEECKAFFEQRASLPDKPVRSKKVKEENGNKSDDDNRSNAE